ncbi:MAG: flavodoxin family protein [Syntrophobacterales bacterium]|nr:flavodoxin family protein [Syntrophobacterales bacterium]
MSIIAAFHASPRQGGNTDILITEALKAIDPSLHRVTLFRLNSMNITPCQNCGGCTDTGVCVIKDGMVDIYEAIRGADRIILASPIFFFCLPAQAKIMIDRCQCLWCEKYLLKREIPRGSHGRKGLLLLAGGMKKEVGVECSEATTSAFFRTISVPEHRTLSYLGIDAKGAILDHPTALADAYRAGENLVAPD